MLDPEQYCADAVAPPGSTLYYSLLFMPATNRKSVIAAHALIEALRRIPAGELRETVGQTRLAWWSEELHGLSLGRARHPVSQALLACAHGELLHRAFPALLDAFDKAVQTGGFATISDLEAFADATGGQLGEFEAELNGHGGIELATARTIGGGLELFQALRASPQKPLQQAWMLPGDLLTSHGVEESDLNQEVTPRRLRKALADYASSLLPKLTPKPGTTGDMPPSLESRAEMARRALVAMRRADYRLTERRIGISPLRKLWIAWRWSSS